MRVAKDFLRKAIQLVNTKRPLIKFDVEKEVTGKMLGKNRTYKLFTQTKEEKSPIYLLTIEVFKLGLPEEWLIKKSGDAGTKRAEYDRHECLVYPPARSTKGQCTDCVQQQTGHV
eukprot:1415779-Ditylum_brightwellii.AAC.1